MSLRCPSLGSGPWLGGRTVHNGPVMTLNALATLPYIWTQDEPAVPEPDPSATVDVAEVTTKIIEDVADVNWWLNTALPTAIRIALIIVIGLVIRWALIRAMRKFMATLSQRSQKAKLKKSDSVRAAIEAERAQQRSETLSKLFQNIITIIVLSFMTLLVLAELGINMAPFIAGAGILGLALGFGAQSLVQDFMSGIFILKEDQYGVGDVIEVDGASGTVEEVQLRITKLRAIDGSLWFVRNGEIISVGNKSQDWSRSLLDIGVAYGTDIGQAKQVLLDVCREFAVDPQYTADIIGEPEMWGVQELAADSVVLRLVLQTKPGAQWSAERALRERIKEALDANGIEIPFPQRTIWVRQDSEASVEVEDLAQTILEVEAATDSDERGDPVI